MTSPVGECGIPGVAVKCADIGGTPTAKAALWAGTDAEERKRGEQTGLDTLVVHKTLGTRCGSHQRDPRRS